jgi:hypothetical protein
MVGVGASQQLNNEPDEAAAAADVASGDAAFVVELDGVLDGLVVLVDRLLLADAVLFAQGAQRVFGALEVSKLAEMKAAGVSDREARRKALAGGTRSKKSASRASSRAGAVGKNPDLADDLAKGELGEEQLDAIAAASDASNGDAAVDQDLVDEVKAGSADEASKITSRWLEGRDDDNSTRSRYDRQRARRGVRFAYDPRSGCESMTTKGDREAIEELKRTLEAAAEELYKADGGRDVPMSKHRRTHTQRMFDALHQLLGTNQPAASGTSSGSAASASSTRTASPVRSMLHVSITVDDTAATNIRAAMIGGNGYLPASVVERYGCSAMIGGTVFSQQGEILWFGRQRRHASPAQFAALIARDGGCVMCGAVPSRCEAHHVVPFNAPGKGRSNVDEMALVCADDHHWLHEQHLTLYWQLGPPDAGPEPHPDTAAGRRKRTTKRRKRSWHTRPATPNEIAPNPSNPRASPDQRPNPPPATGSNATTESRRYLPTTSG